jgi:hypothetical protein
MFMIYSMNMCPWKDENNKLDVSKINVTKRNMIQCINYENRWYMVYVYMKNVNDKAIWLIRWTKNVLIWVYEQWII